MMEPLSRTSSKMKLYFVTGDVTEQANRVEPHSNASRIFPFLSFCAILIHQLSFIQHYYSRAQLPGYSVTHAVLLLNISHFLFNSLLHVFKKFNISVAAHLQSLRADDPSSKGHPMPIKQELRIVPALN